MKDTLYVLKPSFDDGGTTYFCPFSAQVVGFLSYYPHVRDTLNVVELDFKKPRKPLSDILDEQHQSAPMLVLGGDCVPAPDIVIGEVNGMKFVEKTKEILRYLAATRSVPMPH